MLLICIDRATVDKVMRKVHARVCRPHMSQVSSKDYEDWLLLLDYRDILLPVCTEMSQVLDTRRLDTRATI